MLPLRTYAQCPTNQPVEGNRDALWKLDQNVQIALPASLAGCQSEFAQAASLWQSSGANSGFGVNFTFGPPSLDTIITVYHQANPSKPADAGGLVVIHESDPANFGRGLMSATLYINGQTNVCGAAARTFSHELGHAFGLGDCYTCSNTVMVDAGGNYNNTSTPLGPTSCDSQRVQQAWNTILQNERNHADCTQQDPHGGTTGPGVTPFCNTDFGMNDPLIIDVAGDGIRLTNVANGVRFDVDADGRAERTAWTAAGSDDAWLVLDRDGDGSIADGRELFGNATLQPSAPTLNGYGALRVYDFAAHGGNGNGRIDAGDAVWASLRAWQDLDHDGVAAPHELRPLGELRITSFDLRVKQSGRVDAHGNFFRFRAKIDAEDSGRWTYDVFLRSE
ncbi:MAG TPA: hypothetical protein VF618_22790 [Thermoanaerobaculia bacterium]